MAGLGGFIQHMTQTMKSNRALLGKRKKLKEQLEFHRRTSVKSKGKVNREELNERINYQIHAEKPLIDKTKAIMFVTVSLIAVLVVVYYTQNPIIVIPKNVHADNMDVSQYFTSRTVLRNNKDTVKYYNFRMGPKAEEIIYRNNFTWKKVIGYYPSGEIFHTKIVSNDTLLMEEYYFKSGKIINDFPKINNNIIQEVAIKDFERKQLILLSILKGKIIASKYYVKDLPD